MLSIVILILIDNHSLSNALFESCIALGQNADRDCEVEFQYSRMSWLNSVTRSHARILQDLRPMGGTAE